MRKLLIHAGYPKSASTTLQNGVFLDLHKGGHINFLGRAWESGFYGASETKEQYKSWLQPLIEPNGEHKELPVPVLAGDKTNVFSEGLLLTNERTERSIDAPKRLNAYFSKAVDQIDILFVIRSQTTLMMSFYVQNYRKLKEKRFSDFLHANKAQNWSGVSKIFDFNNIASAYADTFGKNRVHLLLFEDLVKQPEHFSRQLASLTGSDSAIIEASLKNKHLNKTKNDSGKSVVKKTNSFSPRALAKRSLGLFGISGGDLLEYQIPAITPAEQTAIFDAFRHSNEKLADTFALDKASMQAYRYF